MAKEKSPPLPANHSTLSVRVLYADTDRMGVAYHAAHFRWFEAARAHYMRERGLPYLEIERSGILFPVVEAHAKYVRPAQYDDVIDITAWISTLGKAQLTFCYRLTRQGEELVEGYTRHAAVSPNGRPIRLPDHIRSALEQRELRKEG